MADELSLEELEECLARAIAYGKMTAAARIRYAIEQLEDSDADKTPRPDCPPSCTGDPWPWCCGGVPA